MSYYNQQQAPVGAPRSQGYLQVAIHRLTLHHHRGILQQGARRRGIQNRPTLFKEDLHQRQNPEEMASGRDAMTFILRMLLIFALSLASEACTAMASLSNANGPPNIVVPDNRVTSKAWTAITPLSNANDPQQIFVADNMFASSGSCLSSEAENFVGDAKNLRPVGNHLDQSTVHTGKYALNRPIYKAPQFEKDVDSEHVELDEDLYDIQRRLHVKSKKNIHELQEGDKVRVLDPFDSAVVGVGRIHSLSIIHGENLKGTSDENVELVRVTSNVPLVYEDKLDGAICLKEKEGSFARWPIIFLEKMN